jgi:hypothetical protein
LGRRFLRKHASPSNASKWRCLSEGALCAGLSNRASNPNILPEQFVVQMFWMPWLWCSRALWSGPEANAARSSSRYGSARGPAAQAGRRWACQDFEVTTAPPTGAERRSGRRPRQIAAHVRVHHDTVSDWRSARGFRQSKRPGRDARTVNGSPFSGTPRQITPHQHPGQCDEATYNHYYHKQPPMESQ